MIKFYKNLYSQKLKENNDSYQTSLNLFLQNENSKMLTQEDKELYECELSKEEILNSLKDLQIPKLQELMAYQQTFINSSGYTFNVISHLYLIVLVMPWKTEICLLNKKEES